MKWSILFSDGTHGPLLSHESALKWFNDIAPDRRHLCRLTCWEEVTDGAAETLRPQPGDWNGPDPFGPRDEVPRAEQITLVEAPTRTAEGEK